MKRLVVGLSLFAFFSSASVFAEQYWFAFYESTPEKELKSFVYQGEWSELSRVVVLGDDTEKHIIFVEATEAEFNAGWASFSNAKKTAAINAAKTSSVNNLAPTKKNLKKMIEVLIKENNKWREWLAQFKADVAASESLADLKTRVAALPATPNRDFDQFLEAMRSED